MRLLKILLLLPLLAYGGAMGYLWYEIKSSADKMVQSAAPVAQISYEAIYLSPTGDEIGLDNIIIRPTMAQDEFRIEQLRVSAPHIGYFINTANSVKKGKPPEYLSMQLQRVHFDIGGELFSVVEQARSQPAASESAARAQGRVAGEFIGRLDALGCGEVERFDISELRGMGIGKVVADVGFKLEHNKQINHTLIKGSIRADKLYELEMGLDLAKGPEALSQAVSIDVYPKLSVNYRDLGFYKLRNKYCAGLNDSSEEAYVEHHIQLLSQMLGASLPEKSVNAYREAMLKGGRYTLYFEPSSDLDLSNLQYYKGGDIATMLGFNLRINDTQFALDEIQWRSPPKNISKANKTKADTPPSGVVSRSTLASIAASSQQQRPREATYKQVAVANAANYLNKMAEVTTYEGKVRRGLLSEVNNGRIYLVMRISAGSLTYPVAFSDIAKLRVQN